MIGIIYAMLAMLSFGISPILYKIPLSKGVTPIMANFVRSVMTVLFLIIIFYMLFFKMPQLSIYSITLLIGIAVLGPVLGDTSFFKAMNYIDVSFASPISSSYALFIVLWSTLFLQKSISILGGVGGIAIMLGIWIIYYKRNNKISIIGILLAIGAAIFYSWALILMDILLQTLPILWITILRTMLASVVLFPIAVHAQAVPKDWKIWIILGIGGLLGIGLGIIFLLNSILYIGVITTGLVSAASPAITVVLGIILFNEERNARKVFGVVLILLGIFLVTF